MTGPGTGPLSGGIVACFGEVLLRFSPTGGGTLRDAGKLAVHCGGAEANVAAALANLGHPARMISALPNNDLGRLALRSLRREGIDTTHVATASGRMGAYYLTPASGARQGAVLYDREGSAFANNADYDFARALEGACHVHVSGISLAVSEASASATMALADAARDAGLTLSFDGNFRPALWQGSSRDPRTVIAPLVERADIFFGNHKDIALLLGRDFSGDGAERRREAAEATFAAFPNLAAMASTARHVEADGTHRIVGRMDTPEGSATSAERLLTGIVDRIGTGDAFAAGVLHRWLGDREDLSGALESGMALAALKHFTPGDFSLASQDELDAAMAGGGDVRR